MASVAPPFRDVCGSPPDGAQMKFLASKTSRFGKWQPGLGGFARYGFALSSFGSDSFSI
ncbi:hypothetical protein PAXRUDRAFT_636257 [Paxillus rubicundulus Ve08.2h10]|uniref:Uncharacterized protein n=1 Tax=Paxillus rubicundulus Ve08.2h10 TaxID=930991 RepID=A0A0D0CAM9_9AGAM|nr:hypothetical protein PAXRUDRAFT_636257 [Paxillus rubicundulus Ve08.2h10]